MKERPVIFSAPMILAIIEARKTQTRRVIKPQPTNVGQYESGMVDAAWQSGFIGVKCPYGVPGDRLWVRETFATDGIITRYYATDDVHELRKKHPAIFMPRIRSRITLEITEVRVQRVQEISEEDITAEGIIFPQPYIGRGWDGEAIESEFIDKDPWWFWQQTWDSINAKRGFGWDANPWVWAVSFKKIEPRSGS